MRVDGQMHARRQGLKTVMKHVGRWTLRAILIALAFIGFLHLTRGTAVRHVRGVAAQAAADLGQRTSSFRSTSRC